LGKAQRVAKHPSSTPSPTETSYPDTDSNRNCYADPNRLSARSISRRVASTIARELAIEVHAEEIVERLHNVS
jgi:hypothetical protein